MSVRNGEVAPGAFRVFVEILILLHAGKKVTARAVARRCGWSSVGWVVPIMHQLRDQGLIRFEDGQAGTVRPRCRLEVLR